ncbi:PAS domain S-box protein [Halostagnicola bangensis]
MATSDQSQDALHSRVRQQEAVTEIGQRALESDDLDSLLCDAAEAVGETLQVDNCGVLELCTSSETLLLRAGVGWEEEVVGSATTPIREEVHAGRALLSEEPVTVSDIEADARFAVTDLLATHEITSGLGVSIGPPDDVWGVLGVYTTTRREFAEHEVTFLKNVSNLLASAIATERTKRSLRNAETLTDRIVETSPVGITLIDADGRNVFANKRAEELLGRPLETLRSYDHDDDRWNLVDEHGEAISGDEMPFSRVKETGESVYDETVGIDHPDGTRMWLSTHCAPLTTDDGEFDGAVYALKDVTEQTRLETELETTLDRVTDAFYSLDENWRFTYANDEAEELIDFYDQGLVGKTAWDEFEWAADSRLRTEYEQAMASQEPTSFEFYYPEPLERWFEVNAYPSETGLSVYFQDISERKEIERDLRASEARFRQFAENLDEVVWMSSVETDEFHYVNPAYEEIWGRSKESIYDSPRSFLDGIHPDDRARVRETIPDRRRGEYDEVFRVVRPDGSIRWVHDRAYPITDEDGTVTRIVGIAEDITGRREMEQERRENTKTLHRLYATASDQNRSFDEKVDRMLEIGRNRLGLEVGYLAKTDERDDQFEVTHASGESDEIYPGSIAPLSETYCRRTIDAEGLFGFADISTTDSIDESTYDRWELDCYLGGEVIVDGERYGTLCFEDKSPRSLPFTPAEETFVELITQWVSYELGRENRERRLQRYIRYTDAILDTIDDVFCVIDAEGRLRRWNETVPEVTAYSPAQIESMEVSALFDTDSSTIENAINDGFETGCARIEAPMRTKDGRTFEYEFTLSALENPSGETVLAGIGRDITDRKARERELAQYERIVETVEDGIYVLDDEYRFRLVNDAYLELIGYSRAEILGEHCSVVIGEEVSTTAAESSVDLLRADQEAATLEAHVERADGERVPAESKFTPLLSSEGEYEGTVGVVRDVTERKRRERELEESERRYRTLVEQFPNGAVSLFDETLRYTLTGGQALDTVDATADSIVGATIWERYPESLAATLEPHFRAALDGERRSFDFEHHDSHWHAHTLPVSDEEGEVFAGMVMIQDITERVRSKRRLEELVDELEESNERLAQFAYAASHDLQEPLRMVSSYLTLVERRYGDALDEDGREFIDFAVDGADRMQEMINGLLAYSRIDTRGDPFEPVDCKRVFDDVLADLAVKIEETDAEITVESLPTVYGDPGQLRQLFQNILDNALTYSGEETPRITVFAAKSKASRTISVRDSGIGIEPTDTDRIFKVFNRLHSTEEYPGAGIGLALCQRIVERHDGQIRVDSTATEGSTFSVQLPAPPQTDD